MFRAVCESHASNILFHAVVGFLRAITGIGDLGGAEARALLRTRMPGADQQDLLLLDDLLGIGDPAVVLPQIAPDARRRRLIALVNADSFGRQLPGIFIVEDAHWIDEVSESMMVDLLGAIAQTPSLVVITYRPEYRGLLARMAELATDHPCAFG